MRGGHEQTRDGNRAHKIEGIDRRKTVKRGSLDLDELVDRHTLGRGIEGGQGTQHGHPVRDALAHADDPARADLETRRANVREGLEPILVAAGRHHLCVVLGRGVEVVVVIVEPGRRQPSGLLLPQEPKGRAGLEPFGLDRLDHAGNLLEITVARTAVGRAHTKTGRARLPGGTRLAAHVLDVHECVTADRGVVVGALRTVTAILGAASGLDAEQGAHLHRVRIEMAAVDRVRLKEKIVQRTGVEGFDFGLGRNRPRRGWRGRRQGRDHGQGSRANRERQVRSCKPPPPQSVPVNECAVNPDGDSLVDSPAVERLSPPPDSRLFTILRAVCCATIHQSHPPPARAIPVRSPHMPYRYLRFFDTLGLEDLPLVGGKNASLGEMYRALTPRGILVPYGFAVTTDAYRLVREQDGLGSAVDAILASVRAGDIHALESASREVAELFRARTLPAALAEEIVRGYEDLGRHYGRSDLAVAVRSSATAEDLPEASFAGQQDSYLNVHGSDEILARYRDCLASLYTARAINYRLDHGFDHHGIALSVGIMKMVRADLGTSGVLFTLDSESGFRDVVFLNAAYGLGENVVQGTVDPDEYYVHKPTRRTGHPSIVRRRLGRKQTRMIYVPDGQGVHTVETEEAARGRFALSDEEILSLADQALIIEDHYSKSNGRPTPMDIEWARDGEDNRLYILQARPETVASRKTVHVLEEYVLDGTGEVIASGRAVGERIGAGPVVVASRLSSLTNFPDGAVLVADTTTPDWEPVMKRAAAIVTNRGGRTCHAAIVARELGIPAVVGTQDATHRIPAGAEVTVSCAEGDTGRVYRGRVPFRVVRTDLQTLRRPQTKILLNIGNPDLAFRLSALPCDGVGLARLEFIISQAIRVHPLALLYPERVRREETRADIARITSGYRSGSEYFIHRLSEGMATIAAAFYPRPVVVRLSDFKSNEYAALVGGEDFEPREENPMLGFRGASRYTHPSYREAFALECAAARRARETLGLDNIILMIPFVRRVDEARRVLDVMAEEGLVRGRQGLKIYMMAEIPNNVLQADAFAQLFDGFSIGSNDLTQLTLGIDRDSDIVAELFDERDPGVLALIRGVVEAARRHGIYSGLCGQAPSDHPEMARFLVELGIGSISLNPDTVLKTTREILDLESRRTAAKRAVPKRTSPTKRTTAKAAQKKTVTPPATASQKTRGARSKPKTAGRGGAGRGQRPKRRG